MSIDFFIADPTYSAKRNLSRHLKNDHGKLLQGKGRFMCEECVGDFVHAKSLINQYGEDHVVQIGMLCMYCSYHNI